MCDFDFESVLQEGSAVTITETKIMLSIFCTSKSTIFITVINKTPLPLRGGHE
jgi:hypothetical protein